jgi:hypothetical protein
MKTCRAHGVSVDIHACHNLNIGFVTKCEVQEPMRPRICLGVKHTFTMGESVRVEAQ